MDKKERVASLSRDISGLGQIRGAREGDTIVFRGIPYAGSPVAERRFAVPEPVAPWQGVLDGTVDGPIAPQTPSRVFVAMGAIDAVQDEDCLTLTIWEPAEPATGRPVMIWLHGGGFSTGAGSLGWYDARRYAERHGIVMVNVNYRLGALGYLSVPGLIEGNLAVRDQLEAVRWVHRHIANFGGDPDNVTLFGQSGGGHTIASLLTIPESEGLFRRAILQSPPLGIGLMTSGEAGHRADVFLEQLGLSPSTPDLIGRLRDLPVDDLLAAQTQAAMKLGAMAKGDLSPPFKPTAEAPHRLGQEDFVGAAVAGAIGRSVDVVIGWTRGEARLFLGGNPLLATMTDADVEMAADHLFGEESSARIADARSRTPQGNPGSLFLELVTDHAFRLPSLDMAARIAALGGRAYVYRFDWASPDAALGACHCIDLPFTFGAWPAWQDAPMLDGSDVEERERLADEMMARWAAFARDGDPGFPAWNAQRTPVLHFDAESHLQG